MRDPLAASHDLTGDLGVDTSPSAFVALGITDMPQRIQAALDSLRGRNFIGAP